MHSKLQAVVDTMDIYQATFPEDACIVVTDTETVVGYLPGKKIDLKVAIGMEASNFKGTVTYKALTTKQFARDEKGSEQFGFAYISTANPIFDGSQFIGVISAIISNDKTDSMRSLAEELSSAVEEMSATNAELAQASTDVSARLDGLVESADTMNHDIKQINQIVELVKDISLKSKILGLNASIEAARSGEHGRGFAVVAKEIQKMAQSSTESADKIATQLENIRHSVETVTETSTKIAAFTQEFAASMHELNDAYSNINAHAENLMNLSEVK